MPEESFLMDMKLHVKMYNVKKSDNYIMMKNYDMINDFLDFTKFKALDA